jgi:hypothetical protein
MSSCERPSTALILVRINTELEGGQTELTLRRLFRTCHRGHRTASDLGIHRRSARWLHRAQPEPRCHEGRHS